MASSQPIDRTKDWILIWVPGTGGEGGEMHPGFQAAVEQVLGDTAQVLCVDYPASVDFRDSVNAGRAALDSLLREVAAEKLDFQRVSVAGSSQGSWVIDESLDLVSYDLVHKAALFGLPMTAPPVPPSLKEHVWVVNGPYDAVTFGWTGSEGKIIEHIGQVLDGRWWHMLPLLGYCCLNWLKASMIVGLALTHFRLPRLSPHDYTPQMPLAVRWLTT